MFLYQKYLAKRATEEIAAEYLDKAIASTQKAIDSQSLDNNGLANALNNLSIFLKERLLKHQNKRDLDEAIEMARGAIEKAQGDALARCLSNLTSFLIRRYQVAGAQADLHEAVQASRRAVEIATEAHSDNSGCVAHGTMGTKGRNFEIATKLPFTLLNCQATTANINVPAYSDKICQSTTNQSTYGCSDALVIQTETSPNSSLGTIASVGITNGNLSSPWQAAHLAPSQQSSGPSVETAGVHGPIRTSHLLRVPIFSPPAFDNNIAPLPAPEPVEKTPEIGVRTLPPHYDDIVGTPSAGGLVDLFSNLTGYGLDGPDEE
ncbi:uncharacterized protein BKA55DRAFT_586715 [Fusarium redolens]|uniref:Uncharacterized protein n=1 Tax=Fusarium redolens TaxID=48865 RepID=A0A9P9JK36_FUSRE|nr:uncharacterized protein BKA55DRAFT_586715 [Fusarium redolens]KAH7205414.1 hypothetical protein BKA55DRAFT_586715 [Fusarium redolens]